MMTPIDSPATKLLACAVIAASMTLAAAQADAQSIAIGPHVGFYKARDADEANVLGGATLRLHLTPALGVEGSVSYRQEKYADDAVTVRSWPVMVTGLLYPLPVVYGAVGAGWYNTTFDYNEGLLGNSVSDETKQEFGWHFGAGAEIPFGRLGSLTADVRWVFLNYDFQQIPGRGGLDSDYFVVTVGLLVGLSG